MYLVCFPLHRLWLVQRQITRGNFTKSPLIFSTRNLTIQKKTRGKTRCQTSSPSSGRQAACKRAHFLDDSCRLPKLSRSEGKWTEIGAFTVSSAGASFTARRIFCAGLAERNLCKRGRAEPWGAFLKGKFIAPVGCAAESRMMNPLHEIEERL